MRARALTRRGGLWLLADTPTFAVAGKGTSVIDLVLVSDEIGEWCKYMYLDKEVDLFLEHLNVVITQ